MFQNNDRATEIFREFPPLHFGICVIDEVHSQRYNSILHDLCLNLVVFNAILETYRYISIFKVIEKCCLKSESNMCSFDNIKLKIEFYVAGFIDYHETGPMVVLCSN